MKKITINKDHILKVEQLIGHDFNNKDLVIEALSHPSLRQHIIKQQQFKDYERLELLGDALLGFIITEILFKNFDQYTEGKLAKIKAHLVSKEIICKIATSLNLAAYIIMTYGEELSGGRENPNNIENTLEALLGAIYLDSNIEKVREVIIKLWEKFLFSTDLIHIDPKTTLQEWAQNLGEDKPIYEVISKIGEAHSPIFTVEVRVKNYKQTAQGSSIKSAEKKSAMKLLELLEHEKKF